MKGSDHYSTCVLLQRIKSFLTLCSQSPSGVLEACHHLLKYEIGVLKTEEGQEGQCQKGFCGIFPEIQSVLFFDGVDAVPFGALHSLAAPKP